MSSYAFNTGWHAFSAKPNKHDATQLHVYACGKSMIVERLRGTEPTCDCHAKIESESPGPQLCGGQGIAVG